jgi:Putative zinc-finger
MTPKFDACNSPRQSPTDSSVNGITTTPPTDGLCNLKRDRFELLSAYLDGEITAVERRQVEDWLKHDPEVQHLYARLLKLRQGVRSLPIPAAQQPVEQTVTQVISRLERRPRTFLAWGGMAIAAVFLGMISNGIRNPTTQIAETPSTYISSDALMIALDRPVVEIPKAPVSSPNLTSQPLLYHTSPGSP